MAIKADHGKRFCNFSESTVVLLISMSAFSDVRKLLIACQV